MGLIFVVGLFSARRPSTFATLDNAQLMQTAVVAIAALADVLIMTCVANGCTKLGLANWVQEIVTGAIIVAAVMLDKFRHQAST